MNLKELNLNKVLGREATLQNSYVVQTSDGASREIWIGLKSGLVGARLIVTDAGASVMEKRIMVLAGQLAQFELGGDIFAVRHSGWGLLGRIGLVHNGRDLTSQAPAVQTPSHQAASPQAATDTDDSWEISIEEAARFSEPLGEEVRVIDNSRSTSTTERKVTVSREWSQSISLDMEKATDIDGRLSAKLPFALGFDASAKRSIRRKYAVSETTRRTYAEEVTLTVNSSTLSTVTFSWRQVWQRGVVVGRNKDGVELRAPFELKLHPTFDQRQEDVKSATPEDGPTPQS